MELTWRQDIPGQLMLEIGPDSTSTDETERPVRGPGEESLRPDALTASEDPHRGDSRRRSDA